MAALRHTGRGTVVARIERARWGGWVTYVHGSPETLISNDAQTAKAATIDAVTASWEGNGLSHRYAGRFEFVPVAVDGDGWIVRAS